MANRKWFTGLLIGVASGLLVALYFTWSDWNLNPGNIFHDEQGVHWNILWDTFFSWWWPIALMVTPLSWAVIFVAGRWKGSSK